VDSTPYVGDVVGLCVGDMGENVGEIDGFLDGMGVDGDNDGVSVDGFTVGVVVGDVVGC